MVFAPFPMMCEIISFPEMNEDIQRWNWQIQSQTRYVNEIKRTASLLKENGTLQEQERLNQCREIINEVELRLAIWNGTKRVEKLDLNAQQFDALSKIDQVAQLAIINMGNLYH